MIRHARNQCCIKWTWIVINSPPAAVVKAALLKGILYGIPAGLILGIGMILVQRWINHSRFPSQVR